jgi:surfeit locus 1 family protein
VTTRKDWIGVALAVLVAALFVRLGFWQLDRLHQRRARNATMLARRALPPLTITAAALPSDSVRDRRVTATGAWDYAHERVWGARSYEGVPGVAVLTPLKLSDHVAVFVDRGWAPSPDALHLDHTALREGDSATISGLAFPAPRGRGDVDPARLRDSLPYVLAPFVILALRSDGPTVRPSDLVYWPAPGLDDGPHLSYAIQWFSFAAIVLGGMAALLRRQAADENRRTEASNTDVERLR